MTSQVDLARHTQIRLRIRSTLDELKDSGVTVRQLIEATRDELQLLHIADEASAKDLHRPGADSSQTTAVNERKEQNPSCHNSPN